MIFDFVRKMRESYTVLKSGELFLKTEFHPRKNMKVFLKVLRSDSRVQVQIYNDVKQTIPYGYLTLQKYNIKMDMACKKSFRIQKIGEEINSSLHCVTLQAKSSRDAKSWVEALLYIPATIENTQRSSESRNRMNNRV